MPGFSGKKCNFATCSIGCINCCSSRWLSRHGLLLPDGREEASVVDAVSVSVEFTAGNADSGQWHCERIYNSDLGQFGLLRKAESRPVVQLLKRVGFAATRTLFLQADSCNCGTGIANLSSAYHSNNLSVGAYAVDYYVYRLCRLII